jgi:thymidylate synthase ThyX
MILPIDSPNFTVFDNFGWNNELIKKAATTCYKSEEKTEKTGDDFVKFLTDKTHFSSLEFAWFPFMFRTLGANSKQLEKDMLSWFNEQKYLEATLNEKGIIVSGNARAWKEYFVKNYEYPYTKPILARLKLIAKVIFQDFAHVDGEGRHPEVQVRELRESSVRSLDPDHREVHDWVMVKTFGTSIGIHREMNRHRKNSINEQSTRYVKKEDFSFIFDCTKIEDSEVNLIEGWLTHTQKLYNYLKAKKYPNDVVRNILPLGTTGEIIHACRVKDWKYFFKLRADNEKAHPELRYIAGEIKKNFEQRKLI